MQLPATALYQLTVEGVGLQRWLIDGQVIGHLDLDTLGVAHAPGLLPLTAGAHELTAILPYDEKLIGNPILPALHGGATAAFLEVTAIIGLSWSMLWEDIESGAFDADDLAGS